MPRFPYPRGWVDEAVKRGLREDMDAPDMREECLRRHAACDALSRKWIGFLAREAPEQPTAAGIEQHRPQAAADPKKDGDADTNAALPYLSDIDDGGGGSKAKLLRPDVDILNIDIPRAERVASWTRYKKKVAKAAKKWVKEGTPLCRTCGQRHAPPHLTREQRQSLAALEKVGRGLVLSKTHRCNDCGWLMPPKPRDCSTASCRQRRERELQQRQQKESAPPPLSPQPQEITTPAIVVQSMFEPGALAKFALMQISPLSKRKRGDESTDHDEQIQHRLSALKKRRKGL